jgi:hypothetical protein
VSAHEFAAAQGVQLMPTPTTTQNGAGESAGAHNLDTVFGSELAEVPRALASADGVARARRLARHLPPASAMLLEHSLVGEPGGIDISIRIDGRDDTRAIVEGRHPVLPLAAAQAADPAWRRVGAFCAAWRDRGGPLAVPIETAWLEFDDTFVDPAERAPPPLFYFSIHRNYQLARTFVPAAAPFLPGGEPLSWLADPALRILLGEAWVIASWPALRVWLADSEVARLRHIGIMWGRADSALLRLCLTVPMPALAGLLAAKAPLPQAVAAASVVAAIAGSEVPTTVLHVDLAPELGPTFGFELIPTREDDWPLILDRLVVAGLCDRTRAESLLGWQSVPWELTAPSGRANHITGVTAVLAERERALTLRRLNHVKLTARTGGVTAKAYFFALRAVSRSNALF